MWQRKFRYILIDEFQDINQVQYDVIRMLAAPENNLFIVGDDDQSIYRFRGARPDIMLGFKKDYPDTKEILLDVNYRSTKAIVNGAARVIRHNVNRYPKQISQRTSRERPSTFRRSDIRLKKASMWSVRFRRRKKEVSRLRRLRFCFAQMWRHVHWRRHLWNTTCRFG